MDGTFLGIGWLWWLLGTFGIAGTVALLALAPTAVPLVVQAIVRFVGYLLSTRWGCALLAAGIAFMAADIHRSMRDEAAFKERTAAFEQAQRARDARIATEVREEVWKEIANSTAQNKEIDADVKEFKDALPPVPHATDNPFRVGTDSCRLRRIAGQTECGHGEGTKRVPAPRPRPASGGDH